MREEIFHREEELKKKTPKIPLDLIKIFLTNWNKLRESQQNDSTIKKELFVFWGQWQETTDCQAKSQ